MPLVKASKLTGTALDWAVATCEGWAIPVRKSSWFGGDEPWLELRLGAQQWVSEPTFEAVKRRQLWELAYSTDWAQGGPIIEREKIDCVADPNGKDVWMGQFYATRLSGEKVIRAYGPTPLIAAMRCYVASKLGEEVEIPKELV